MATYEFTLPDGRVVEVSSDGDMTMDQAVAAFQQMQAAEPAQQGPTREQLEAELAQNQAASLEAQRNLDSAERLRPVANALGVFEPVASMASGAANTVLGGLAGLDAALDPRQPEGAGAAAVERFADRTYQPVTGTGQSIMQAVAAPFQWFGQKADDAGQIVSDTTGSPLLGAAMRTLIEGAPELVGARGVGPAARRAGTRPPLQPTPPISDSAALARAAGLEVRPSDVRAADPSVRFPGIVPESLVESIAGSDRLRYDMSLRNQLRNTEIAARAIGAPEGAALTPELYRQLRAPHSAVYDQVAQTIGNFTPTAELQRALDNIATSLPEAASPAAAAEINRLAGTFSYPTTGQGVLNAIADLRQRARANSRPSDGARAEVNEDIARAQRQIAEALESEMERQLTLAPRIEGTAPAVTADQFRAARQALARIHDVEDATVAGQVDVGRLRRARDRGAPLSGELAMLADLAEMYPNVTRHPQSFTSPPSTGDLLSGTLRSVGPGFLARRYLQGGFQQRLGAVGDESILSRYAPEPAPAPRAAPVNPDLIDMPADGLTPPRPLPARPSNLSGELELVQEALPGGDALPIQPGPYRAPAGSLANELVFPDAIPFEPAAYVRQPVGRALAGEQPLPLSEIARNTPPPQLALPAPVYQGGVDGSLGTEFARREIGLTPGVSRAAPRHPGAPRDYVPPAPPAVPPQPALPPPVYQGGVDGSLGTAFDRARIAQALAEMGLTSDVLRAAPQHPGAPRGPR